MNMTSMTWLIRRELWEHRAIWMVPTAILGLLLLAAVTGNIALGNLEIDVGGGHLQQMTDEQRATAVAVLVAVIIGLFMASMAFVGTFYALDALYADRRDRSVLFWKSLPVSDLETVLAKLLTAAVVIPLHGLAAGVIGYFIVAIGASVKLAMLGGPVALLWMPGVMLQTLAMVAGFVFTYVLWVLPVIAWLLLASAWAPRAPFLWATLPVFAAAALEKLALGTDWVVGLIDYRISGMPEQIFSGADADWAQMAGGELLSRSLYLFFSPDMWLGWAAAAGLMAATIWVRRYREESI